MHSCFDVFRNGLEDAFQVYLRAPGASVYIKRTYMNVCVCVCDIRRVGLEVFSCLHVSNSLKDTPMMCRALNIQACWISAGLGCRLHVLEGSIMYVYIGAPLLLASQGG